MDEKQVTKVGRAFLQRFGLPLKYMISSLTGSGLDYLLFYLSRYVMGWPLTPCFIASRFVGATVNFSLNKFVVFRQNNVTLKSLLWDALKYAILWCVMATGATALMNLFSVTWGIMEMVAKILADTAMFLFGYVMQRYVIFRQVREK